MANVATSPPTIVGARELRPYRSHRTPACDLCRSRKIRCNIDIAGQCCRFCRERGVQCSYSSSIAEPPTQPDAPVRPAKRQRHLCASTLLPSAVEANDSEIGLSNFPGTSPTETSLLMNPTMAEDIEVLEKYLTSNAPGTVSTNKGYSVISNAPGKPIIYLTVPRHRKGLHLPNDPGKTQREVMDQILRPFQSEIIKVYFDHLHPCFPIVDKTTFLDLWRREPARISSTLVCDIYASALLYWHKSNVLKHHTRPDLEFAWNQAVRALQDDFMAPSITTIHSALLDMVGRPILQISGNIINAGRTITLAHSLGLHRDFVGWNATTHEKQVRVNLWWGCLIQDHWSSLAHGTPPNIQQANYDVPMPTIESLLEASSVLEDHTTTAMSFIKLCLLTEILGSLLPLLYSLHLDEDDAWKGIRRLEHLLDEWEDSLPKYLQMSTSNRPSLVNGSANLWFCFLSVKLLLCRVTFKLTAIEGQTSVPEAKQYRLALLRNSALVLVDFVTALHATQLSEFWLPQTAYLLVSAATILLRCVLESTDLHTKRNCALRLVNFQKRLITARDISEWDLAEFCLARCSQPIERISSALATATETQEEQSTSSHEAAKDLSHCRDPLLNTAIGNVSVQGLDSFVGLDSWDFSWETLWDTHEECLPFVL